MGPTTQGLTGGIYYLISYSSSFIVKITATDLTNDTQAATILANYLVTSPYSINQFVYAGVDLLLDVYSDEALSFYELIKKLAIAKAVCFGVIFSIIYLFVFFYFLNLLKLEIWQTQSIINMIPDAVLVKNKAVQEQVCRRRNAN